MRDKWAKTHPWRATVRQPFVSELGQPFVAGQTLMARTKAELDGIVASINDRYGDVVSQPEKIR